MPLMPYKLRILQIHRMYILQVRILPVQDIMPIDMPHGIYHQHHINHLPTINLFVPQLQRRLYPMPVSISVTKRHLCDCMRITNIPRGQHMCGLRLCPKQMLQLHEFGNMHIMHNRILLLKRQVYKQMPLKSIPCYNKHNIIITNNTIFLPAMYKLSLGLFILHQFNNMYIMYVPLLVGSGYMCDKLS